jgi:hypothetical protein
VVDVDSGIRPDQMSLDGTPSGVTQLSVLTRSLACYRTAARLSAAVEHRYQRAAALSSAAELHLERGSRDDAVRAWREALDLLDLLDHPSADEVRVRLEGLAAT